MSLCFVCEAGMGDRQEEVKTMGFPNLTVDMKNLDVFEATAKALKYAMLFLDDEQFEEIKKIYKEHGIDMEITDGE